MQISSEEISAHLPVYLTQAEKDDLVNSLRKFNEYSFYTSFGSDELLQGDGWGQLDLYNFETGERREVTGIVLSNSCDVAVENERTLPPNIVFVPLVPAGKLRSLLEIKGLRKEKIEGMLGDMRAQRVTSVFYLPAHTNGPGDDHIAFLDNVHSLPAAYFLQKKRVPKMFTLSQMGFYLFLFKLSVHFCRFGEKLHRYDKSAV